MNKAIEKSNRALASKGQNKEASRVASKPSFTAKRVVNKTKNPSSVSGEEYIVRKSIQLKALPSEVWDALTNPEKTRKYFFNCEVFSDWKVGSPITFKGRVMFIIKVELNGKIVKIEPGKLLKYTLVNEAKGNEPGSISTVTDSLTYADGLTTLSITDDVGKTPGAERRYQKSLKGWDKILRGLKRVVESNKM